MKVTIHNAKLLTRNLTQFILDAVTPHRSSFEVSSVKKNECVIVRFRSSEIDPAIMLAEDFISALSVSNLSYEQLADECKFSIPLGQFHNTTV